MKGRTGVRWLAAVAAVAVLATVAGMSTASGAQSGFTLRIGVVVPFTGASAVFGPAYARPPVSPSSRRRPRSGGRGSPTSRSRSSTPTTARHRRVG